MSSLRKPTLETSEEERKAIRNGRLLGSLTKRDRIIEIGPSMSPIAPKAEGWSAFSVDHATREELLEKYSYLPAADLSRIEAVDYVCSDGAFHLAVPSEHLNTFDALIASHVIEHAPDLISFLNSAEQLVNHTGSVVLAIPDKRYCFDYFQPVSLLGNVLEAHSKKLTRHSLANCFNHLAYFTTNKESIAWGQLPIEQLRLQNSLEEAKGLFDSLERSSVYVDVHAWFFTPSSFRLLILELARLSLTDWMLDETTDAIGIEFYAWLKRGGKAFAASMSDETFRKARLNLLEKTLVESKTQIDFFLEGERRERKKRRSVWSRAFQPRRSFKAAS